MADYYNIALDSKSYAYARKIYGLTAAELHRFVAAFKSGQRKVAIKNTDKALASVEKICIYDCSKLTQFSNEKDLIRFLTKSELNYETYFTHFHHYKRFFGKFGNDVTTDFITGPWGYEANQPDAKEKESKSVILHENINPKAGHKKNDNNRIFISHSSKDHLLVNSFCDLILNNALGIDTAKQVFNTSLDGSKPHSGEDFRKSIKEELQSAGVVLQFITKNYKSSEVCLNEMGAAWVLNGQVIPLVLEPGAYDVGFINSTIQQVKLWDADALFEFVDNHKGTFFPAEVTIGRLNKKIKEFVEQVNQAYSRQ